jgi:hypothetical protein
MVALRPSRSGFASHPDSKDVYQKTTGIRRSRHQRSSFFYLQSFIAILLIATGARSRVAAISGDDHSESEDYHQSVDVPQNDSGDLLTVVNPLSFWDSMDDNEAPFDEESPPADREAITGDSAARILEKRRTRRRKMKRKQFRGRQQEERKLQMGGDWMTMKLIVEADTQAYRRLPEVLQRVENSVVPTFKQGDLLVGGRCESSLTCAAFGNNNMFRRHNPGVAVGISYQTCVTPTIVEKSINTWMCTWVISFSDLLQNQIMAQGTYYRSNVTPMNVWFPDYQFIAITGGTGIFRSTIGFIILAPKDLGIRVGGDFDNYITPTLYYYFVYKLF